MVTQILTTKFMLELIGLLLAGILVCGLTKRYYREVKARELHLSYFTTPINNALLILTLLIPALIALATSLFKSDPEEDYSTLLATISALFFVLIVAFWLTFALLRKGSEKETVTITIPNDTHYIAAMGLMYALMLVGFLYGTVYFLFELPSATQKTSSVTPSSVTLAKSPLKMDLSREEVERLWGEPSTYDSPSRRFEYDSLNSKIYLEFDRDWKLAKIQEVRKESARERK